MVMPNLAGLCIYAHMNYEGIYICIFYGKRVFCQESNTYNDAVEVKYL